jgi:threonine/homoserine/homoserine lactone efflux protein
VDARFLAYLLVSAILIVTPGPDMALVARNAVRGGPRAARSTAFGVGAGILLWGLFTSVGLASALAASAVLFSVLKLVGAAFLVALGLRSLWAAARPTDSPRGAHPPIPLNMKAAFAQGLLGNLLNPKAGAIFVAVVPQFIEPTDAPSRLAAMTGAFVVMVTVWLVVYGFLIARTAKRFGPAVRRALDGFAGAVMVGLGVRLAVERR